MNRTTGSSDGLVQSTLKVLDYCIARVKWRLRPAARRRLETDVLALLTRLRPVVMVDYGGKMPELQEHLRSLLHLAREEIKNLPLRVMIIEDMIYMIHVGELAEYASSSINLQKQLYLVDLEQNPPKMLLHTGDSKISLELLKIQKLFSLIFFEDKVNGGNPLSVRSSEATRFAESTQSKNEVLANFMEHVDFQKSDYFDLSSVVKDTQITQPTLNGWLLGYPVVYLLTKDHDSDAVYNLSTKSLHLYMILARRMGGGKTSEEEIMSFTVPYDLSLEGPKEPWAEAFLSHLLSKLESCRQVWSSLRLEVNSCQPQAIAL